VLADRRFKTSANILLEIASVVLHVLHGASNAPG
jgi:hypothetical protein